MRCIVEDCERPVRVKSQGLCGLHYMRKRRHGDTAVTLHNVAAGGPMERFEAKRTFLDNGCWGWTGLKNDAGYAMLSINGKNKRAHRWSYETFRGPIPEGLELDHVCHTKDRLCPGGNTCPHRCCTNPWHLEPVDHKENTLRGRSPMATHAQKTHCDSGHPFDDVNTRYRKRPDGSINRDCRRCDADLQQRKRDRMRSEGPFCSIDGCDRFVSSRGWCQTHYTHYREHGHPVLTRDQVPLNPDLPLCKVHGCGRYALAKGCCQRHRAQERRRATAS